MITANLIAGDEAIQTVPAAGLASLLWQHNNHFFRVAWASRQNDRLKKTGDGAAYKSKDVRKLYVASVRNNYSFRNRVNTLLSPELQEAHANWTPQERKWGVHVNGTPFVHHRPKQDNVHRLYGHFLPMRYFDMPETGYYVDGEKAADDAEIKALEYERKEAADELGKARSEARPVNPRLDDVLCFKVGGTWYAVEPASEVEIEGLVAKAMAIEEQVVAAANLVANGGDIDHVHPV
jgi:hypothetical protein